MVDYLRVQNSYIMDSAFSGLARSVLRRANWTGPKGQDDDDIRCALSRDLADIIKNSTL
jgi:hypothetical protein